MPDDSKTGLKISGNKFSGVMNINLNIWLNCCHCVLRWSEEMYNSEYLWLSVKHHAGSVMVWGCISASSVEDLLKINLEISYRINLSHMCFFFFFFLVGNSTGPST